MIQNSIVFLDEQKFPTVNITVPTIEIISYQLLKVKIQKDKIIDKADYINRHERCEGLNYVILGGETVVENAVYSGKKMGRFIPRQR